MAATDTFASTVVVIAAAAAAAVAVAVAGAAHFHAHKKEEAEAGGQTKDERFLKADGSHRSSLCLSLAACVYSASDKHQLAPNNKRETIFFFFSN